MNNKGFTLTELLAVILILSIIAIITIPTVLNVFNENKYKSREAQINTIVEAAKKYTVKHPLTDDTNIYLNQLIEDKLLDEKALIDPGTNQKFSTNACVVVTNNNKKITYEFNENCS